MRPKIICLTPIKNEAWILTRFLQAASLWADCIIIADQLSTDDSRDISSQFPKVKLIKNPSTQFNEPQRQKLLISEARKIQGKRLLIALDADEMFSPEILSSDEWNQILNSEPGTIINFQWANIWKDQKKMWLSDYISLGYMDDGCEHTQNDMIHTTRIPVPKDHPILWINEIKIIHLQYAYWERMISKQYWYQCYEHIIYPQKSTVNIFRDYHHMFSRIKLHPIPSTWISEYATRNIFIYSFKNNKQIWFDEKVLSLMNEYGTKHFQKLRIWGKNWESIAKNWNFSHPEKYKDPRTICDVIVQWWLFRTQPFFNNTSKVGRLIRRIDKWISKYLNY